MEGQVLRGRVAIVTGAASGIGRGIAREYAREGAAVALLDRNDADLTALWESIRAEGGEALPYVLDVTDYDRYHGVVADVVHRLGHIDILVNNAGITLSGTILSDTLQDWRTVLQADLEAVYMGSKLVAPHMVKVSSGRIISTSSVQAFYSSGDGSAYSAAKAGIVGLTKSMATELGRYGIAVNAIAPGFIRTAMSLVNGVDETTTPDFQHVYIERGRIPMRRAGTPEDIAGTAVFLASDYCRYMTGQLLIVDGGLTSTF